MKKLLIIALLFVGCEDEEEPMGLCYFLTQLDNLTASSIDNYFESFHWECKDSYTQSECCEDIRAEEICPAAYHFICYGNEMNVDGSNNFEFPQSWIWKENTTCEEYENDQFDFKNEMHSTRVKVEMLLAEGRISEAETYMEKRRLLFVMNGYTIRKLNQAYFAFHGTYGDSPASVSPIAGQLRLLRDNSSSLGSFIRVVGQFGSYKEFVEYLENLN